MTRDKRNEGGEEVSEEKKMSPSELLKEFNRELLIAARYTPAKLTGLGDLSQLSLESLEALIQQKAAETLRNQLRRQKIHIKVLSPPKRHKKRSKK
jgi:hypothetical protein